jgi:small-conductance mechanosensitive channel
MTPRTKALLKAGAVVSAILGFVLIVWNSAAEQGLIGGSSVPGVIVGAGLIGLGISLWRTQARQ